MVAISSHGWVGSRIHLAWFLVRATGLRLRRSWQNKSSCASMPVQRMNHEQRLQWPSVLSECITPLWSSTGNDDWDLVAGKIQNLRVAAMLLNGVKINAGETFSFWHVVGRPTKRRGFVAGRELREGCMIASIGGGLCQLSNALYCAAADASMSIIERHQHSKIVPGSLAEIGRDATVFWNYVDLKFKSSQSFVIEATLTQHDLVVRLRVQEDIPANTRAPMIQKSSSAAIPIVALTKEEAHDCVSCAHGSCIAYISPTARSKKRAVLLDEMQPEFDQWLLNNTTNADIAFIPLDGIRRNKKNYAWSFIAKNSMPAVEHFFLTAKRSRASRSYPLQGVARQLGIIEFDRSFAYSYARKVSYQVDALIIAVQYLPYADEVGALGGRTLTVLMNRAPLSMLQSALDDAAPRYGSSTLTDFRTDTRLVALEEKALKQASRFVTAHRGVAQYLQEHYRGEVVLLDWILPALPHPLPQRGKAVLLPASALARKGVFEVKAACKELKLDLHVLGKAVEREGFWEGLPVKSVDDPKNMFDQVGCVVLPAIVEHQPRLLLTALSMGIPVIATPACGLPEKMDGLITIAEGNAEALVRALRRLGFS